METGEFYNGTYTLCVVLVYLMCTCRMILYLLHAELYLFVLLILTRLKCFSVYHGDNQVQITLNVLLNNRHK